jgi:hypothetical protein
MEKEHLLMPDHEGDPWQDKEETRTIGHKKNLKFKRPNAQELESEVKNRMTPKRQFQHEDHEQFRKFYAGLNYNERTDFGNKTPEEKESIFIKWLQDRNTKTA